MTDLKAELHRTVQASRAVLLSKLDNLSEYDRRRPMTPTGSPDQDDVDEPAWREYAGQIQAAADTFAAGTEAQPRP